MTDKPLTPGEVRKILDVTDATVRNYVARFAQFLSPDATRKTRKRFSESDVKVLQLARKYLEDGHTYEQVIGLLESMPPDDILDQEIPPPVEKSPPAAANAILPQEFYKQFEIAIAAKDAHITDLQKEIAWLRLPWWKRIFRDPPE